MSSAVQLNVPGAYCVRSPIASAPSFGGGPLPAAARHATLWRQRDATPMIDLHCHILPGLDDGASDFDDSAGLALQALRDGIETVCATPHIRHDHAVDIASLPGRVAAVEA